MGSFWQDVKYGARMLQKSPGFAVVALVTLALGIGLNTAMFSVVHAVLLRPLDFPAPERLVMVWETRAERGIDRNVVGAHEFPAWKERSRSFDGLAAMTFSGAQYSLTGSGDPLALRGARVSADFFRVMGTQPALGRTFLDEENVPGRGQAVVLSHKLWRSRFGGDPQIIGRQITLNDRSFAVVGVMPEGFEFPSASAEGAPPDVWAPIAEPIHLYVGRHYLFVVGRLKAGVSVAQAQTELTEISRGLEGEFPGGSKGHGVNVKSLHGELVGDVETSLLVLLGVVGLVLLIACANVANLMLARAAGRKREIAMRGALGAGPMRLVRQLLTESVLLSGAGAGLGVLLAAWLIELVPQISPSLIPRIAHAGLNPLVLGVTAAIALITGAAFGLAPALQSARLRLGESLKEGGRSTSGRESHRLRNALVVAEIALALVPLIGAGLLLESFVRLRTVHPGFNAENILEVELSLAAARYREPGQQAEFYRRLYDGVASLPGVKAVGGTNILPLGGSLSSIPFTIEGRLEPAAGQEVHAQFRVVSEEYFRAMLIPLREGRTFTAADTRLALPLMRWYPRQPIPARFEEPQAAPAAVINEAMARQVWPGESPIGRRVRLLSSPWVSVIGVVGDVRHSSLGDAGGPEVYLFDRQEPQSAVSVVVRTEGDPMGLAGAVREQVWRIDPGLPVQKIQTMDDVIALSVSGPRFLAALTGAFSAIALALMLVGVYGVISYAVAQRIHEIGVRMALGAQRSNIYQLVMGQGLKLAAGGVALGLAGALAMSGVLRKLLFGVGPTDLGTFAVLAMLVLLTALGACWLPARRAVRVDPLVALRHE